MKSREHSQFATQGLVLTAWAGMALAMANIADGISIDPVAIILYSLGMAILGHRMQSFFALASFAIVTVLTAVLVSGYQGISVSSEQFFNPYFGLADVLVLIMMWSGPLVAVLVRNMDYRIIHTIKLVFSRAINVEFKAFQVPSLAKVRHVTHINEVWSDQFFYQIDYRRGPPVTV